MSITIDSRPYEERIKEKVKDHFMRDAVSSAQGRFRIGRKSQEERFGNWEEWKNLGEEIREHTLQNLDYYLHQLSESASKRGTKVFFAETSEEANEYIRNVVKSKKAKKVVKSKSMVTEEIGLNESLLELGIDIVESDLGEWILQLDDDKPSHIIVPALHKNKEQIKNLFTEKKGFTGSDELNELASFAREQLRNEFLSADIGITGCNFAVAESGSVTFVTNEGNARMVTALPDTQIAVMGMERIVPGWEELDVLVSLLTRASVGQALTSYVTAVTGVREEDESDGPTEYHLVIIDNGRSKILGTEFQSILHCIRCAACINVCPVYRQVGGHAYGSIYPGPVGAVLTPLLDGYEDHKELPYASTLCAACTEVCPVKIPLHEHLIRHRQIIVEEEKLMPKMEKLAMKGYANWASSSAAYILSTKLARSSLKFWSKNEKIEKDPFLLKAWTDSRTFPLPAKQSFRTWYKKQEGKGDR